MVNMGNVWDRTTEFLSDNAGALMPIVLLALLVPHSVSALVGSAGPAIPMIVAQAISLLCALIALWAQLAVVALALDPDGGRARAVSAATVNMGRAIAAMLLLLVALIVLALPILGLMIAKGVDLAALSSGGMARANLTGGAATFATIYMIALVIVVIFIGIRLALLYPVIVAEGGVVAAIRRSWAVSRGIVWKMIGVWLLFGIVYFVALAAVTSGIGTVIGFVTDMREPFSVGRIVIAILSGIVSTGFTVIVAAFSAKLYRAAIAAREGATFA